MRILAALLLLLFCAVLAPAADPVTDDHIYDQVRVKLVGDRDVGGENIQVKVSAGVVELTGTVRKESQRTKAAKIAKKVKGVKQVVNQIRVSTMPSGA